MNIGDVIHDEVIGHAVDLQRFDASVRRRIHRLFAKLERELVAELAKVDPSGAIRPAVQQARLETLLKQTRQTIRAGYDEIGEAHLGDMIDLGRLEAEFALLSVNNSVAVDLMSTALTPRQIKSIASDVLIEGAPSSEWWARQSQNMQRRFSDEIRIGMLRGEGLSDLTRRIRGRQENGFRDGVMMASTRSAEALIRTSVQTVANDVRLATYQANADVVKGIQWVATLDLRTSQICMALNGKVWDLNKKPVGHTQPFPGPTAHWNCRSTQISVLKSWDELATAGFDVPEPDEAKVNKLFRQNLKHLGFSDDDVKEIARNGRSSKDGQISKNVTFDQWLRRKGKAAQDEMLGPIKAKMWRDGKITLNDLIDQRNRPLTVAELESKIRRR